MPKAKDKDEPDKSRGYIQYLGMSGRRGLTVEDFQRVGVTDQTEDVWWTRENGWRVWRSNLSDAAYAAAVEIDTELVLIGGDVKEGSLPEPKEGEERVPMAAQMTQMPPPPVPGDYMPMASPVNMGRPNIQPVESGGAGESGSSTETGSAGAK